MATEAGAGRLGAVCLGPEDEADDANVGSQLARAVLQEINALRRNPAAYAEKLSLLRDCYRGDVLVYPHSGMQVKTTEGVAALDDCLADLCISAALPNVMLSQAISKSCGEHLADLRSSGHCSHVGTDGSTPEARLARAGQHREQCGENVVFGLRSSREVVYHMLLDDGAAERGHRANLLNPDFRFAGIAFGSHPAAGTSTVILFTDHFRARAVSKTSQMKNIAEEVLGEPAVQHVPPHHASERHWDKLMQELKPAHLRVPDHLHAKVTAQCKPRVYKESHRPPPTVAVGVLRPIPSVDPAIVRAFHHRVDVHHVGTILEGELLGLIHQKQLDLSPEELGRMFDEALKNHQKTGKPPRGVSVDELVAAVQCQKRYVPAVDMQVNMAGGSEHVLTVELDELFRWSEGLYSDYIERCPGLAQPPRPASATEPRNTGGAGRIKVLNRFLTSVVEATLEGEVGRRLQDEPKVQCFFGAGMLDIALDEWQVKEVVCMSCRRLWSFQARPFREQWLTLIRAAGLEPLVPLPERFAEQASELVGVAAPSLESVASPQARCLGRNTARPVEASVAAVLGASGRVRTRDPAPKVQVRGLNGAEATEAGDLPRDIGSRRGLSASTTSLPHWEEKRQHAESLVNQIVDCTRRASRELDDTVRSRLNVTPPGVGGGDGTAVPQLGFTFEARRKFQQVLGNQSRASDERRFLGADRRTADPSGIGARRNRGTGAHSTSAPAGVRGHFHNSVAVLAAEGCHAWPQSLDVRLDGEHIDHSRAEEMKPDPRYSKMAKEERDRQFSCYFGKRIPKVEDIKLTVARDQTKDLKSYSVQPHEFRADAPERHGKFGRRTFDPQVCEMPAQNPRGIGQIEAKPVEEFRRQQERVDEFLDRALPRGQNSHFKTHLPRSQLPDKYEEMSSREKMNCVMDGGVKRHQLGFFQNRHSDHTDFNLYSRPLGASQLDRKLPLA